MNTKNPFSISELKIKNSILGISSHGGYITDWQVKSSAGEMVPVFFVHPEKLKRTGIPPLLPYFGPSKDGQHGFGRDSEWKYSELGENEGVLILCSEQISDEAKVKYPYEFLATIHIRIEESTLLYRMNFLNLSNKPAPVLPGIHPYFYIPLADKKSLKIAELPEFDSSKIDWEIEEPDMQYPFGDQVAVEMPDKTVTIKKGSGSKQIDRVTIWSEPGTDFICIEPIAGKPGQLFDENPILINSGENFLLDIIFSVDFKS